MNMHSFKMLPESDILLQEFSMQILNDFSHFSNDLKGKYRHDQSRISTGHGIDVLL